VALRTGAHRLRALPWALVLQGSLVANDHWRSLPEAERARLVGLIRDARGWPGNMTAKEREELRVLLAKLDLVGIGRDMVPFVGRARRGP
jgi:hypothetical protein